MNEKPLFAWERYTKDDCWAALTPIHSLLWRSVMEPWRDLEQYRRADPNFRHLPPAGMAQWLHYQIIGRVQGFFPEISHAGEDDASWHFDDSGMFHLDYRFTQLTFKKLDSDFQRSNVHTPHNDDYWTQHLLPGMPILIRLIVGYQWTDETATDIKRLAIVCPARRGSPHWWYEIPPAAESAGPPTFTIQPPPDRPEESEKGFRIKPKKKSDEKPAQL